MRQNFYSVPVRFVGQRVDVRLGADTVTAVDGDLRNVAEHVRLSGKHGESLVLDHYLETLALQARRVCWSHSTGRGPQMRSVHDPAHDHYLKTARRRLGDQQGTRAMVEVLLAHRHLPTNAIQAGIQAALLVGGQSIPKS